MADKWEVISQAERVGPQLDGSYGPVVRITIRTAGGVIRHVDIPAAHYQPDRVRELLDAEATKTDEIAQL